MGNLSLEARDLRGRGVKELLGLPRVQRGRDATLTSQLGQAQTISGHVTSASRDEELPVQRLKEEVGVGHVRDERRDDPPTSFFGCQILRARGLVQPSHAAPHVQLPAETEPDLEIGHLGTDSGRQRTRSSLRHSILRRRRRSDDDRKSIRAGDTEALARLQHAFCGDPQIEILHERGAHQLSQRVVSEQIEPLRVSQRSRFGLRRRPSDVTEGRWDRH